MCDECGPNSEEILFKHKSENMHSENHVASGKFPKPATVAIPSCKKGLVGGFCF